MTSAGEIRASYVVVAAGAWSADVLREYGVVADVVPVRGQMLLVRGDAGLLSQILLYEGHYLIPRRDGHILIGSTIEHVGFDKSTTTEAAEILRQSAYEMLPELGKYPVVMQWAGLRPGTLDGVPYIGEVPGAAGLYVNTGHFRNGVTLAPASVRLLVDLMTERSPIVDPVPYAAA